MHETQSIFHPVTLIANIRTCQQHPLDVRRQLGGRDCLRASSLDLEVVPGVLLALCRRQGIRVAIVPSPSPSLEQLCKIQQYISAHAVNKPLIFREARTHRSKHSTHSQIPSSVDLPSVTFKSVSACFKAVRGWLTDSRCTNEASKLDDEAGRSLKDLIWLPQLQD